MHQFLKAALWGCVTLIFLCSPTRAADPATQSASTKPSTVTLDLTDPKKAYESMAAAVMAEDPTQVKACIYFPNAADSPLVDAVIEYQIVLHQVGVVILNRFGIDGKRLMASPAAPMMFDDDARKMLEKINAVPAVINGDKATLKSSAEPMSGMEILMRRVDGKWKLDSSRFLSMLSRDREKFLAESKARNSLLLQWSAQIMKGAYKDVDDAKAGLALLESSAGKTTAVATSLPASRWKDKADRPNLTALQKAAYEQLAQLQDCNLQQMSVPGSPMLEEPAPGTTDATVKILKMGLDVVPILVEALDDTTPTKTSPASGHMVAPGTPKVYWTVNLVVAQLIQRICERDFSVGEGPNAHYLGQVSQNPELAPILKKVILDWYNAHRNESEVDRRIDDVADSAFRNRLDAVEWLGRNKVVKAGSAIGKYVDRTLAAIEKQDDSLKESEISECAFSLGEIGDKGNLPEVQKVCQRFSSVWDERHRPIGSMDIGDLFQAYHGMAMLGAKDAAIKELTRLYESYHGEMETTSSDEFKNSLDDAAKW